MVLQGGPCGRVGHRRTPFRQNGHPSMGGHFALCWRRTEEPSLAGWLFCVNPRREVVASPLQTCLEHGCALLYSCGQKVLVRSARPTSQPRRPPATRRRRELRRPRCAVRPRSRCSLSRTLVSAPRGVALAAPRRARPESRAVGECDRSGYRARTCSRGRAASIARPDAVRCAGSRTPTSVTRAGRRGARSSTM